MATSPIGISLLLLSLLATIVLGICSEQSAFAQRLDSTTIFGHFVIQSPQISEFELLAHTVDIKILFNAQGTIGDESVTEQLQADQLIVAVQSSYRFHNQGKDDRTYRLTLSPQPDISSPTSTTSTSFRLAQQLNVQLDNEPLGLQTASDGTRTFELGLGADQRRAVVVTYSFPMGTSLLPPIIDSGA